MNPSRLLTAVAAAAILAVPAAAGTPSPTFWNVPGTDTDLRVYGMVTLDAAYDFKNATGPAGSLPLAPNVDAATSSDQFDMTDNTLTRFGFDSRTQSPFGPIATKLECDFGQVTGGANTLHIRKAYGTIEGWLFGQNDTTFSDPAAHPEYIDWVGLVGDYLGGYRRPPQVRYTCDLSKEASLIFAIEKTTYGIPPTTRPAIGGYLASSNSQNSSTFPGSLVAACNYGDGWGHVRATVGRQKYAQTAWNSVAQVTQSKATVSWALSGNVRFGKDNFTWHEGVGDGLYGAVLGDGVYIGANGQPYSIQTLQSNYGYAHPWNSRVRSNAFFSEARFNEDAAKGVTGAFVHTWDQYGANTFVEWTHAVTLGVEYIYGVARTFSGAAFANPDGSRTGKFTESKLRVEMIFQFN